MRKLDCNFFYHTATYIEQLNQLNMNSYNRMETVLLITQAKDYFSHYITENPVRLRQSLVPARAMLDALEVITSEADFMEQHFGSVQLGTFAHPLQAALREFEVIFSNEIRSLGIYQIDNVRSYDVSLMIEDFTKALSEQAANGLSATAIHDWKEAGKCLAFGLYTASGFHLLRVVEAVILDYYHNISGNQAHLNDVLQHKKFMRSWKSYIEELKIMGASHKILWVLKQLKDLHRNPLMHPEDTLSENQAHTLIGITVSLIEAIYEVC